MDVCAGACVVFGPGGCLAGFCMAGACRCTRMVHNSLMRAASTLPARQGRSLGCMDALHARGRALWALCGPPCACSTTVAAVGLQQRRAHAWNHAPPACTASYGWFPSAPCRGTRARAPVVAGVTMCMGDMHDAACSCNASAPASAIKATAIADPRAVVLLLVLVGATTNPYGAGAAPEARWRHLAPGRWWLHFACITGPLPPTGC